MTPFIIFEGQLQTPDDTYFSVERNLLLKVNGGHTSALVTLLLMYFVCNIRISERMQKLIFISPERSFEWTMSNYTD